jgi:hypothetical protein
MASRVRNLLSGIKWYEFAPEAVLAAGLGLFAVTEPHAAASAFHSSKAILLMVAVGIGWLAARAITFRLVARRLVRAVPFVLGALVVLKVVVLPAYDNRTVVETLVAAPPPAASGTPAPSTTPDPINVRQGELTGIDHRAAGTVNLYRRSTGDFVVGLEDFDIQPGPAYVVYVVPGAERRDHDGGTRLAGLRGNKGTQFYDVPAEVDLGGDAWTVLVWCETFDVPVAHATPA